MKLGTDSAVLANSGDQRSMNDSRTDLSLLRQEGICRIDAAFPADTIGRWNALLDPLFAAKASEPRSEFDALALFRLGIFSDFFTPSMRSVIRSVMPDAVLYHFHVYEIQAHQAKPHISSERFAGWHADTRRMTGLNMRDLHYVSIFVYLTPVGLNDGAFEISSLCSEDELQEGFPSTRVTGEPGTTFLWNRSSYHRASPNEGPVRRRLLKVSIQHNYLENAILSDEVLSPIAAAVGETDPFVAFLLGKHHRFSHHGLHLLPESAAAAPRFSSFAPNSRVHIPLLHRVYLQAKVHIPALHRVYSRVKTMLH